MSAFLTGSPKAKLGFKNTSATRNYYACFNLECLAGNPVGYYYYHHQRAAIYSSTAGLSTISCGNFSSDSYRVGFMRESGEFGRYLPVPVFETSNS